MSGQVIDMAAKPTRKTSGPVPIQELPQFARQPAAAEGSRLPWREWDGVAILDACGCITFCSTAAAQLLGGTAPELLGEQITALIPELPFGRFTPEFNLAYVFFHGDDGVWTRRALLTRDGWHVPVDVSLGRLCEIGKRSIVLILRQPVAGGACYGVPMSAAHLGQGNALAAVSGV